MDNGLWKPSLKIEKVDETFFSAEQVYVSDDYLIQYNLPASLLAALPDLKETISPFFTKLSSSTLFVAIDGHTIRLWFLSRGKKVIFRKGRFEIDRTEKDPYHNQELKLG